MTPRQTAIPRYAAKQPFSGCFVALSGRNILARYLDIHRETEKFWQV